MERYYYYLGSCLPYPEHCLAANEDGFCYLCETITNVLTDLIEDQWVDENYEEFGDETPEGNDLTTHYLLDEEAVDS